MRIHVLQHVPFEGPAGIGDWAAGKGHSITITPLFEHGRLPDRGTFDWLVVMGGPMGVRDEADYPWMATEKELIDAAIAAGKTVIGVCLGAQLIAAVLGVRVYPNAHREIGWYPIELTDQGRASDLLAFLPHRFEVFHWHGDTFDLPDGAVHLASSEGCGHQAFLYADRVLGLQFHLESTPTSVADLVANCADEIIPGKYVQDAERMLAATGEDYARINRALFGILDRLPA
ncbi:type 1 glutamine amidotransferase [Candidatus Thiosymbion oneisti]|uniref:type 1 glutamine amidotransferase n=1 Tax=Candidatus Thiosymbion oneisti TaxID=589554 RepID=UPI000A5C867B|nr:type 1 glutamine amidotransferase [Candidatus Thiosymbion oneisti]